MNITELRYLVAIMKWGSVSAAAKQMYAAQPNVSKALKNLEEEYGIRMFERSSTGMIPTEQGRHFIEQAQRVLQEVDRLDADARRRQGECAELRVALPHATYAGWTLCCAGATIWPCCATPRRTRTTTAATVPGAGCTGSRSWSSSTGCW